ncbi:hypothetical protein FCV25MIE_01185 [Fagus crenata]
MVVFQKLEMCLELVRLSIKFVIVVAEAVSVVIQENGPPQPSYPGYYGPSVSLFGLLP